MAKKNMVSNPPKPQAPSMPTSHSIILGAASGANPPSQEDDEDDICPVCESECTCRNRARLSQTSTNNAVAVSAHSISTSSGSFVSPTASQAGLQSLKIKLTLPPSLRLRQQHSQGPSVVGVNMSRVSSFSSAALTKQLPQPGISAHPLALGAVDPTVPKRRGRPPKDVVAAREAAKAALVAHNAPSHSHEHLGVSASGGGASQTYAGKGNLPAKYMPPRRASTATRKPPNPKGKITTDRKLASTFIKGLPKSVSSADLSDAHASKYPTFVSATSSLSHSSSSESSDTESSLSSLDSDTEGETHCIVQSERGRAQGRKVSGADDSYKRWGIHSRKQGVGVEFEDADVESDASSEEGVSGASGDDTDDEGDEDDNVDADTEGNGMEDVDLDDEETSSRIGITYSDGRGAGWSDDEESSFDADLFFANLDDSSDSDSSPEHSDYDPFNPSSDFEVSGSAVEETALLLMDVDPSVQMRRSQGDFEFGLELGELSFGWDGHVFFTSTTPQHTRDFGFELQGDVDMREERQDSMSKDSDSETADEVMLEETDGETTEDELIGTDGLPNSRAMTLFRWPSAVTAVDPLSTVHSSASSAPQAPPNASESVRIALASYTGHQSSPAPAKLSADELEIDMEKSVASVQTPARTRAGCHPAMGEFLSPSVALQASAVIDGKGPSVPSPFPRSKAASRRKSTNGDENSGSPFAVPDTPSENVASSVQSSEEVAPDSQLEISGLSSAEAIDLDDVLDSSFLDSEPMAFETQSCDEPPFTSPSTSAALLSRWDRIPMATFRRTREVAKLDGSASDTGLSVYSGMGTIDALLTPTKPADKKSSPSRKRSKAKGGSSLGLPFDPFANRDGERTPTLTSPQSGLKPSKRELKREKAMMKRKMMSKPPPRHQAQYRTHSHHPNFKSRASGSMQRMNSFGGSNNSSPSFGL